MSTTGSSKSERLGRSSRKRKQRFFFLGFPCHDLAGADVDGYSARQRRRRRLKRKKRKRSSILNYLFCCIH